MRIRHPSSIARLATYELRDGVEYVPFLTVRTPSHGVVHRLRSALTGRVVHCLSIGEADLFRLFEADPQTAEVREQFPLLPHARTEEIATELGIRHPAFAGKSVVMTTDFVVRRASGRSMAFAFKPASELDDARTLQKLRIEQRYWDELSVPWVVITDRQLPEPVRLNLRLLHNRRSLGSFRPADSERDLRLAELRRFLEAKPQARLASRCSEFDSRVGWPRGEALAGVWYAVAQRLWPANLATQLDSLKPVSALFRRAR